MVRSCRARSGQVTRAPHARGDGPASAALSGQVVWCSPRTWGWSTVGPRACYLAYVLPTHVGMVLRPGLHQRTDERAPHARGDGPRFQVAKRVQSRCSPRTWGWSVVPNWRKENGHVLPTHVGMVRSGPRPLSGTGAACVMAISRVGPSPHAWGAAPRRGNERRVAAATSAVLTPTGPTLQRRGEPMPDEHAPRGGTPTRPEPPTGAYRACLRVRVTSPRRRRGTAPRPRGGAHHTAPRSHRPPRWRGARSGEFSPGKSRPGRAQGKLWMLSTINPRPRPGQGGRGSDETGSRG